MDTKCLLRYHPSTDEQCIPGVIHYNDSKIQLLDLPGIIEGASEGKGRGRQALPVFCWVAKIFNDLPMDMRAGYLGLQECGPSADGARCHQALGPQGDPHQGAGVSGHAVKQVWAG
eukprot:1017590-Pelagomonas_calceolata.AAC.1